MARTYRRATNKSGHKPKSLIATEPVYDFQWAKDSWKWTADMHNGNVPANVKHFDNVHRRAFTRMTIAKYKNNPDAWDEVVFNKDYENPWNWD